MHNTACTQVDIEDLEASRKIPYPAPAGWLRILCPSYSSGPCIFHDLEIHPSFRLRRLCKSTFHFSLPFSVTLTNPYPNRKHTMVLVEEVKEEIIVDRESDYETESEFSDDDADSVVSEDDFDPSAETFADRVAALKDIVPPETRKSLVQTAEKVKALGSAAYALSGNVAWWVCTSAILVALPLALASENEAMITQQERELQMQNAGQQQVSRN